MAGYPLADPEGAYSASAMPSAPIPSNTLPDGMPNMVAPGQADTFAAIMDQLQAQQDGTKARNAMIQRAWDAYYGMYSDQLRAGEDGRTDAVKSNRCSAIVDGAGMLLLGEQLGIEVHNKNAPAADPNDDSAVEDDITDPKQMPKNPWQEYVDTCFGDADAMMTMLYELYLNGALGGHFFWKLLGPGDTGTEYCALDVIDSTRVSVVSDPNRSKQVNAYIISYAATDVDKRQIIERIPGPPNPKTGKVSLIPLGWLILDQERDAKGRSLAAQAKDDTKGWVTKQTTPWDYPFAPIIDGPNLPPGNDFWGRPTLTDNLINLNKSIQFTETNIARIIKQWEEPLGFVFGAVKPADIQRGNGNLVGLPADSKVQMERSLADITQAMSFADNLRVNQDEEAHYVGALARLKDMPRGTISGVALRTLNQPGLMQMNMQRRTYGPAIRAAVARFLVVGGLAERVEDVGVELHWGDPLPVDDLASAQAAAQWSQLGVSDQSLMEEYTPFNFALERARKAEEAAKQLTAISQGMGLPAPTMPPSDPTQPPADPNAPPPAQPQGNMAALNSPKAQMQRQLVSATAKATQ